MQLVNIRVVVYAVAKKSIIDSCITIICMLYATELKVSDTDTASYGRTRRQSRRHAKYIIPNSDGDGRVKNVCV